MSLSHIIRPTDDAQRKIAEGLVELRGLSASAGRTMRDASQEVEVVAETVARNWVSSGRWTSAGTSEAAADRIVDALIAPANSSQQAFLRTGVIALARSNREVHHVTRRLRERMRTNGLLKGPDLDVSGVSPMGVPVRFKVAVGDRIRFLVRSRALDVYNGTCARIVAIEGPTDAEELSVEIEDDGMRPARFALAEFHDQKRRVRIAPAYVATIYGVQGLTEERTVVLKGAHMSFREFYVAATRAAVSCEVVEVNPKRAFLQSLPESTKYRIQEIANELAVALRRDKPKSIAEAHRKRSNLQNEPENAWPFAAMLRDLKDSSAA